MLPFMCDTHFRLYLLFRFWALFYPNSNFKATVIPYPWETQNKLIAIMGYTGNPILRFVIYIAEKEKRRKENPL